MLALGATRWSPSTMKRHVIFVAPFFMDATLRFLAGTTALPEIRLSLISQDPAERLPEKLRNKLDGHYRIEDGLDAQQIVDAARQLMHSLGPAARMFGPLEQLQVPLARAREVLGLPGLSAEAASRFRDKALMKTVLQESGLPCARHLLTGDADAARRFVAEVGFPVVVKPPAGAGGKNTFRLNLPEDLGAFLHRYPLNNAHPTLFEEFVRGTEFSFDSVLIDGKPIWHSISQYMPTPLEVLENGWIQWCVMLPREIDGEEFDSIADAAFAGLAALGMQTGFSHMEWFRMQDGRIAISEVGARPPGAQFSSLISYAHDVDFYRLWPRLMVFDEFEPPMRKYAVGAAYLRGQGSGVVKNISGLDLAQRQYGELVVEAKLPVTGQAPSDSYEGDGFVILRHPDTRVIEDALRDIVKLVRVELG